MGMSAFQWSDKIAANAKKCADAGKGQMKHCLAGGSMGQVICPGKADAAGAKSAALGWWCEGLNPGAKNGDKVKSVMGADCANNRGINSKGQLGHYNILSGGYKTIGCALSFGLYFCDFA